MSNTTVSIDISDGQVVAVVAEGSGKTVAASKLLSIPVANGASPEELAQSVAEVLNSHGVDADGCSLLLGSETGLFRSYFFPFSGRSQVQQGLDYELSEELPLPLDSLVYDFSHTRSGKKFSRVCAAAYKREYFAELLHALVAQGISPARIEPEVCAIGRAAVFGMKKIPENSLLVDMGRNRTVVVAMQRDLPASIQVLPAGIRTICAALDDPDEAERQLAFTDFSARDNFSDVQKKLAKALDGFLATVSMAVDRFQEQAGEWGGPVFLSGELCCIQGVKNSLSSLLERDAVSVVERSEVRTALSADDLLQANFFVASFGGCLSPAEESRAINFRKGEFALPEKEASLSKRLRYYAVLAFLCVLAAGATGAASLYQKSRLLQNYRQAANTLFSQALPDVSSSLAAGQKESILISRIDRLSRAEDRKDGSGADTLMLEELMTLTKAVKGGADVEFDRLSRDPRRTSISGTAKSYELVEAVRNGIASAKVYESVEIKGASAENKTNRVRFEIVLGRK